MRFFILFGVGCVFISFGCAIAILPILGLFCPFPVLTGLFCLARAQQIKASGGIFVFLSALYLLYPGFHTAAIASEFLLALQRSITPPPIPYSSIYHWFLAPTIVTLVAIAPAKSYKYNEAAAIWAAMVAIFPLTVLIIYLMSESVGWGLSA
jgi:hypothetical protein